MRSHTKRIKPAALALAAILLLTGCSFTGGRSQILIADFEGSDYGKWEVEGEAFGSGPAAGTLEGQKPVDGFIGEGLVNTFYEGDKTTGTLTSPGFRIRRPWLVFLVGGGHHPGSTAMELLVDGEVVRTVTGPARTNQDPETLDWFSWAVEDLEGKKARLRVVDNATGGWGHINIDHILLASEPRGTVQRSETITLEKNYVQVHFANPEAKSDQITLAIDDKVLHNYRPAALGDLPAWVSLDVSRHRGKTATVTLLSRPAPDGADAWDSLTQSNQALGMKMVVDKVYDETYRPQYHFTPRKNWTNDPNGLMYYAGEYHLFFQHNPLGINWGNMTWGQAVSTDLLHWQQLDHAIHPDNLGTIFSGSGVVDHANTSGFKTGKESPLICFYTSAGNPFTQSIAYSNDRGRTWTKYEDNPVIDHIVGGNRDPKVIWHEPTSKWVMVLYLQGNDYTIFSSPDTKNWTRLCDVNVPGASECPDFFQLPVDGNPDDMRWVFWGASNNYLLGTFDGEKFTPEEGPHPSNWGRNYYAAQTWSDIPQSDGRRIQIAWMNGGQYPGMPFNQQMSFPVQLTLRTTPDGVRLYKTPIREIDAIRDQRYRWRDLTLAPGSNPLEELSGEAIEIEAEFWRGESSAVVFTLRGEEVRYDFVAEELSSLGCQAPMKPEEGRVQVRILLDRSSLEVFGNDGRVSIPNCFLPDLNDYSLAVRSEGGAAEIARLDVYTLKSIWPEGLTTYEVP